MHKIIILVLALLLNGCATTIHSRTVKQFGTEVTETHIYISADFIPARASLEPALPSPSNPGIPKQGFNNTSVRVAY